MEVGRCSSALHSKITLFFIKTSAPKKSAINHTQHVLKQSQTGEIAFVRPANQCINQYALKMELHTLVNVI